MSAKQVIAFCGTRGVPASYGGFETAVDEITRRFVDGGIACEVFCRTSSAEPQAEHAGRQLQFVRGSKRRSLDTFVSSFETGFHLLRHRKKYRHAFWFNNANLPGILLTRLAGIPMSVNTDGLEWRRAKWGPLQKLYYLVSSFLIARTCETLISDSRAIQDYYRSHFFKATEFIPYGTPARLAITGEREREILREWRLERGRYLLQVTRTEPDNLPLEIAEGFAASRLGDQGYALVSVGVKDDTPYARALRALDGTRGVRVRGAIYDPEVLQVLRTSCRAYVHGNSVGGTNPALLEAMSTCPRIVALDCEFSREVLADTGCLFALGTIARDLEAVVESPDRSEELRARVDRLYRWDAVARDYAVLAGDELAVFERAVEAS